MTNKRIKVGYILSYYSPNYIRTLTLVAALKLIDHVDYCEARNQRTGIVRYLETAVKFIKMRLVDRPDIYILGFRGFEIFWFIRILTLGKPLIYDHMMSPHNSLMYEKKTLKNGSIFQRLFFAYERSLFQASDLILTDTTLHKNWFAKQFRISQNKIQTIYIGADERNFIPRTANTFDTNNPLNLFFFGTFIPLHGIHIILQAAKILQDENKAVHFLLAGTDGSDMAWFYKMMHEFNLNNVTHKTWIEHEKLPEYIETTDLCLGGPFGDTQQAKCVVTGKAFHFLAMGKATIIGEIDEDDGFVDRENCLLIPQGNAKALADTISWSLDNREKLATIGLAGQSLYERKFSNKAVAVELQRILNI